MLIVDLQGLIDKIQRIQDAIDVAPTFMELALAAVAEDALEKIQQATPYDSEENNGFIPGEEDHLRDSFSIGDVEQGASASTTILTSEPIKYSYVTQGTLDKAPIVPVTKGALYWPALGHPIRSVAGQAANPFQDQVLADIEQDIEQVVMPLIHDWLDNL